MSDMTDKQFRNAVRAIRQILEDFHAEYKRQGGDNERTDADRARLHGAKWMISVLFND